MSDKLYRHAVMQGYGRMYCVLTEIGRKTGRITYKVIKTDKGRLYSRMILQNIEPYPGGLRMCMINWNWILYTMFILNERIRDGTEINYIYHLHNQCIIEKSKRKKEVY